jgi:DNA-binding LacI/PurR family transcriptional regulator
VRVRQAAEDLDFQPNIVARSLISGKSQMVGMIVNNLNAPFISEIVRGAERAARDRRHHIVVCEAEGAEAEMDSIRWLRSRGVDGLIMVSGAMHVAEVADYLGRERLPLILVNQAAAGVAASVSPDHHEVGRLAAEIFAEAGYKRLGYLGVLPSAASALRAAGFTEEAKRRGVSVETVTDLTVYSSQEIADASKDLAQRMLDTDRDAVLCFNDFTAAGFMNGLRALGTRVPDDVAVMGVDNLRFSPLLDPPLASIDLNLLETGRLALEYVLQPDGPAPSDVAPKYVYRASAGKATGNAK